MSAPGSSMEWDEFVSQVDLSVLSLGLVSRDALDDLDWFEDDASGLKFLLAIAPTNAVIENEIYYFLCVNNISD